MIYILAYLTLSTALTSSLFMLPALRNSGVFDSTILHKH